MKEEDEEYDLIISNPPFYNDNFEEIEEYVWSWSYSDIPRLKYALDKELIGYIEDFLKNKPNEAIGLSLPSYENDKNPKTVYVIFEDKTFKEFGKY